MLTWVVFAAFIMTSLSASAAYCKPVPAREGESAVWRLVADQTIVCGETGTLFSFHLSGSSSVIVVLMLLICILMLLISDMMLVKGVIMFISVLALVCR